MTGEMVPRATPLNLLFAPVLEHGGIETLIVRFSTWLVERGETVIVATEGPGPLLEQLPPPVVRIVGLGGGPVVRALHPTLEADPTGAAIRSFSFTARTLQRQLCFHSRYARAAVLATGVFHERAYSSRSAIASPGRVISWMFDRALPDNAKWFMNAAVKRAHEERYRRTFGGSLVAPLPLALPSATAHERRPQQYQLLSIGRLVPWKTYIFDIPEEIARLRNQGVPVEWVVVGDGPARAEVIERVRALAIDDHIRFAGTVPYSLLGSFFSSAWAFVGVGTSLLEAAAAGVPAICAVTGQAHKCYGFADEVPEPYCVGESVPGAQTRELGEALDIVFSMDGAEYEATSERMVRYCQVFSIDEVGRTILNWVDSRPGGTGAPSVWRMWPVMMLRAYQNHLRRFIPHCFLRSKPLDELHDSRRSTGS